MGPMPHHPGDCPPTVTVGAGSRVARNQFVVIVATRRVCLQVDAVLLVRDLHTGEIHIHVGVTLGLVDCWGHGDCLNDALDGNVQRLEMLMALALSSR